MLGRLVAPLRAALATSCSHLATLSSQLATSCSQLAAAAAVRSLHSSAPHHSVTVAIRRLAPTVAAPSQHHHLLPAAAAPAAAPHRAISLETIHRRLQNPRPRIVKRPLDGAPQMKGVVLKTLIKKPKKPNSANRRCCLVRLSNGKEMVAYIPGEGHNLQEHNIVLVRVGRLRDVPGVKLKCIRGKYDLSHVVKKTQD